MFVSIIIPARNASATLAACLEACVHQSYPEREIIVVDDGSTDSTPRIAGAFPVEFVRQERQGPAAARNRGARLARGEILAYTDSDCVPDREWLARLIARFDEGTAAVGGTYGIANEDRLLARMIHEEIMIRHERFGDYVDFLGSFNVAYRKEAFDRAGGFDEHFTAASGEDNDLAYRLMNDGGRLRFARDAVVAHHHPEKLGPYLKTQMRHGFWRMKIYAKHPVRARGDRYAGLRDLLAPLLALAAGLLLIVSAVRGWDEMPLAMAAGAALLLAANRAGLPWRMARRTGDSRMLWYAGVLVLRDAARAAGMVWGIYTFLIARKAAR